MTVAINDLQALDLLAAPSALCVRLARCAEFAHAFLSPTTKAVQSWKTPPEPELIADAAWWPMSESGANNSASDEKRRTLHGEIRIPEDVSPSCLILNFQLQVS